MVISEWSSMAVRDRTMLSNLPSTGTAVSTAGSLSWQLQTGRKGEGGGEANEMRGSTVGNAKASKMTCTGEK